MLNLLVEKATKVFSLCFMKHSLSLFNRFDVLNFVSDNGGMSISAACGHYRPKMTLSIDSLKHTLYMVVESFYLPLINKKIFEVIDLARKCAFGDKKGFMGDILDPLNEI